MLTSDLHLTRARQRLRQVLRAEEARVVPLATCRLCGAPVGEPCSKGATPGKYPRGAKTRPHVERRLDARLAKESA